MLPQPQPITVIVADDHPIVRDGILTILAATPHLRVVATVASFQELLARLPSIQADVVIPDVLGMGSIPLTLVHRLTRDCPTWRSLCFRPVSISRPNCCRRVPRAMW